MSTRATAPNEPELLKAADSNGGNRPPKTCSPLKLESGGDSVEVLDLRDFVVQRVGSVDALNLPDNERQKKTRLDYLLFRLVEQIPNRDAHSGFSDAVDLLVGISSDYLRMSWVQVSELGNRLASGIIDVLLDLHQVRHERSIGVAFWALIAGSIFSCWLFRTPWLSLEWLTAEATAGAVFFISVALALRQGFLVSHLRKIKKDMDGGAWGPAIASRLEVLYWCGLRVPSCFIGVLQTLT